MKEKELEITMYEKFINDYLDEEKLIMKSELRHYLKCLDEILYQGEIWRDYIWERNNNWKYLNNKYGNITSIIKKK